MIPDNVDFMIALDMDETYRPVQSDNIAISGIRLFETRLAQLRREFQIVFGLITGSNLSTVITKLNGYANVMPDFIASSLGTELHWFIAGEYHEDLSWASHVGSLIDFQHRIISFDTIVAPLKKRLIEQPPIYQGGKIKGYYLSFTSNIEADINLISRSATKVELKAEVTECSPAAGDPEGCFDVAVMPLLGGKAASLRFLSKRLSIERHQVIAVGDGCNDIGMLTAAGQGYLVRNSSVSAKKLYPFHTHSEYCWGVLEILDSYEI